MADGGYEEEEDVFLGRRKDAGGLDIDLLKEADLASFGGWAYDAYLNSLTNLEEEDYGWAYLPQILLEDIFTLLDPKRRHVASQVCRPWYQTFYAPRVWETFVLKGFVLTKRRFNFFKGFQIDLCPRKTQVCLHRVGHLFKRIIITPIHNFYNLFEFLRILSAYLGYFEEFPMPHLHTFHFTFACETRGMTGAIVHGTGGKILDELKELLGKMQHLKNLKLNHLLLDEAEVTGLMDAIAMQCEHSIKTLEILNCSKGPYPLVELSSFDNLQKLVISPQHVNDEVIVMLGTSGLTELHLVQGRYTCEFQPVSDEAWRLVKQMSPYFKVILEIRGHTKAQLGLQPHAPVSEIIYDTPYAKFDNEIAISVVHYYHNTLERYVQKRLPRSHGSRSFHHRSDSSLIMIARNCPKLQSIVVQERISTATAILIATEAKSLQNFIVRQNGLIKRADWPKDSHWTDDFYRDFKASARCYEKTSAKISQILGRNWQPVTDQIFKRL